MPTTTSPPRHSPATDPDLAKKITAAIRSHGAESSGKIEILFGEAKKPLPFRQYRLVEVKNLGGKVIKTEAVGEEVFRGWEEYADLLFPMAAIASAESDAPQARQALRGGDAAVGRRGLQGPGGEEDQPVRRIQGGPGLARRQQAEGADRRAEGACRAAVEAAGEGWRLGHGLRRAKARHRGGRTSRRRRRSGPDPRRPGGGGATLANSRLRPKRKDDAVEVKAEKDKTLFIIKSPSGISQADIERKGEMWPDAVLLRLHLKGLESFRASNGKVTLDAAVGIQEGRLRYGCGRTARKTLPWTRKARSGPSSASWAATARRPRGYRSRTGTSRLRRPGRSSTETQRRRSR